MFTARKLPSIPFDKDNQNGMDLMNVWLVVFGWVLITLGSNSSNIRSVSRGGNTTVDNITKVY